MEILDEIPEEAVMYLINALAFEAEWEDIYDETQIWEGTFTAADGTQQSAEFMSSKESLYLEDENATGFLKYYAGRDYAFVALLPREGVSVADYVSSLTGEHLQELLENPEQITTYAKLPKFETEYDLDMTEILIDMGMTDAFDPALADFTRLGNSKDGNIFIGKVLHKTYLSVAEQGTKAGAATVVVVYGEAASPNFQKPKEVHLDRPFVYMLVDCEQQLPFFIGCMIKKSSLNRIKSSVNSLFSQAIRNILRTLSHLVFPVCSTLMCTSGVMMFGQPPKTITRLYCIFWQTERRE